MTLRTPRRRISPRTKRRYRAIKDFLRRALGSSSQPDIKINSSIAINVTDLKHKINGLEHQLNEVNKHCQDLACLDTSSRKDCPILVDTDDATELASLKEQSEVSSIKKSSLVETELLYKTPESHYGKSEDSNCIGKVNDGDESNTKREVKSNEMSKEDHHKIVPKDNLRKKKSKLEVKLRANDGSQPNLRKHKTQSAYENFMSNVETSSYHSLIEPRIHHGYSVPYHEKKHKNREYAEPASMHMTKAKRRKDHVRRTSPENMAHRESRHKHKTKPTRELDQDFIAEVIQRQYKPVKMFGKRESGMSQLSAPICRDHEFTIREDILEGSDLCSCCIDERKRSNPKFEHQLKNKHSICDARLYSSKKQIRHRQHPKEEAYHRYNDIYNDADQYDLIPVKEKSSPKSRRRVLADTIPYNYYKEVPPSPRTQRPRLNLKAQYYTEFQDYMKYRKELKHRNYSPHKYREYPEDIESNESSAMMEYYKSKRKSQFCNEDKIKKRVQQDAGTMSGLPSPLYQNEQNNVTNDNPLNKSKDSDISADKTDKALTEIKDILQTFLQEIKKEATSGSHCGNSEIMTPKTGDKCLNEFRPSSTKLNTSVIPESGVCVNSFGIPQCNMPAPFISPFSNPCCYPILPVCPMNCMQNGFVVPSPSYTCNCVNNSKDAAQPAQNASKESNTTKTGTDTEELIKEIYKVVAQNPNNDLQKDYRKEINSPKGITDEKILTSRSVGGSLKISKHDAEVGTHKVRCHSRSCEAIGSRMMSESLSRTNPTYSDTVLERLSLEASASNTDTESTGEHTRRKKVIKQNKLAKVLRSFGLFKKKKDAIEEVSESESTVEVSIEPKPPFRQEVTNYAMHRQEYYNRPPMPPYHEPHHSSSGDYHHGYGTPPHCHHGCPGCTSPRHSSMYDSSEHNKIPYAHRTASPYRSPRPHPSAPPYPNPYDHHHYHGHPQAPLCLKEIEVKSIGTQSERKLSFFRKFGRKVQDQRIEESGARNCCTQTVENTVSNNRPKLLPASKLAKFNWKTLQAKVNELDGPNNFSLKTQQKLAHGDMKMRNAMLKKMFYKRNPFSPRNLIVRTLLGKDKSSYGDAPMMYRPRMFL